MRTFLLLVFSFIFASCLAQTPGKLIIRGNFTRQDSAEITQSFVNARMAVDRMKKAMDGIWERQSTRKTNSRIINWREEPAFVTWLGGPEKIRMVRRKIRRIDRKFDRRFVLEVHKENNGKCRGWIGAWTVPFGPVRIRLCDSFFGYRTNLQEKILVHELGHEAGMLFHRKIHFCWAARRAAASGNDIIAKRSPENYAWLAMSYIGLECGN